MVTGARVSTLHDPVLNLRPKTTTTRVKEGVGPGGTVNEERHCLVSEFDTREVTVRGE